MVSPTVIETSRLSAHRGEQRLVWPLGATGSSAQPGPLVPGAAAPR